MGAAPAPTVVELGESAQIGPGLSLSFVDAEVTAAQIIWRGTVRNNSGTPQVTHLDASCLRVTDSTEKPYAITSVTAPSVSIPAGGSADLTVVASILPFSPVAATASYLQLEYAGREAPLLFRRAL